MKLEKTLPFLLVSLTFISLAGCSSAPKSLEERAYTSVIKSEVGIVSINDNPFVGFYSTTVEPGRVRIKEGSRTISCNIESGYVYEIDDRNCVKKGRTTAAAELSAQRKMIFESGEKKTYFSYKEELSKDVSVQTLEYMKSKFSNASSGIFKEDPESLQSIIDQRLAPVIAKRNEEAERIRIETEKLQKAAQKKRETENRIRFEQERDYVSEFRESLAVGADTNCGLIIEVNPKLVKLAFPVKDYGNEHWIKRGSVFPPGYNCTFRNGQYVAPSYRYYL